MTWTAALALVLVACEGEPSVGIRLDGPARLSVDKLGRVAAPMVVSDSGEPVQVAWTATPDSVAHVRQNEVHAVGPGDATVTGTWEEQTVSWSLHVQPTVMLRLVAPPGTVRVGQPVSLSVEGRSGDQVLDPGPVKWVSSDESVLTVDGGTVTGVQPGLVYVTASARSSEAMLELKVVE